MSLVSCEQSGVDTDLRSETNDSLNKILWMRVPLSVELRPRIIRDSASKEQIEGTRLHLITQKYDLIRR